MRTDIIHYLEEEIRRRCEKESNFFGMGGYHHIRAVVKNAVQLAGIYGADVEVVTIAAWLHDAASITDYALYENHHIYGAEMAGDFLREFGYDKTKLELVQKCILNHRGSKVMEKQSPKEICVADADSMSHFDAVPSLFYLAYVQRKLGIDDGIDFVKNKLNRSYQKLSERGKEIYKDKYEQVISLLV